VSGGQFVDDGPGDADRVRSVGLVAALCVVSELRPHGVLKKSAIDKQPVAGRRQVGPEGLLDDTQIDRRFHGGTDKALYAYSREDADFWAAELGRDVPSGLFGENLATQGLDLNAAVIGERWLIGHGDEGVLAEVSAFREPCGTFQSWLGIPGWMKRFNAAGRPGTYLRVVVPGTIGAGDPVEVLSVPAHGITIGQAFAAWTGQLHDERTLAGLRALRDGDAGLAPALVRGIDHALRVAG
jgi:MOSC domain-containing protein YiiM